MRGNVVPNGLLREGFVGLAELQPYIDALYPNDRNLATWIWMILLRDRTFFNLMYPKFSIAGRSFDFDIRHRLTGWTREEWLQDADDCYELLSAPEMWVISIASLRREYHKLYVHDEHWRCPDAVNHDNYRHMLSVEYAEIFISQLALVTDRDTWVQQARVQGLNPCVYSVIQWWVVVHLSTSR